MDSIERFDILEPLGRGGQGHTYLAIDRANGNRVALKRLSLRLADDWKAVELFEREGRVLRQLAHPQIPRFVDALVVHKEGVPHFYLAQEYVEGRSLQDVVDRDPPWPQERAEALARSILGVLAYLGTQRPPIVHRDIKPANLIQRPSGEWTLVDFGAVQAIVPAELGGSTVVGTLGYAPPEQIMGRADPRSDLYALGAVLVQLMTGTHPAELTGAAVADHLGRATQAPASFAGWLGRMTAIVPEDRFASATAALDALDAIRADVLLPTHTTPARDALVERLHAAGVPAEDQARGVRVELWSPLLPWLDDAPAAMPLIGAAWASMAVSAGMAGAGWFVSGLALSIVGLAAMWAGSGRLHTLTLGPRALHVRRGLALSTPALEIAYSRIDDIAVIDREFYLLVGAREVRVPTASAQQAQVLAEHLRVFLRHLNDRPHPLSKPPKWTTSGAKKEALE